MVRELQGKGDGRGQGRRGGCVCASRVCWERMLGKGYYGGLQVRGGGGAGRSVEETRGAERRWEGVVRSEA